MNENREGAEPTRAADEIRILDLFAVLVRQWKVVAGAAGLALGLAALFLVLQPRSYQARTVLLPVQEGTSRAQHLFPQLPPSLLALAADGNSNRAQISAILKSSSLADSMVNRLAPEPLPSQGEAEIRHILARGTTIKGGDGGAVIIEVRGKQPALAARIANEFPEVINRIMAQLGSQTAMRRQAFLESQLATARVALEGSEQRLLEFQQLQDAPELQEQARRTLEAAALLQRQIMEQEVRVAQLRRSLTPDNPELRAATSELEGWRAQLRRLTTSDPRERQVFLSLRESPELQLAATRLLREFKKDEQVYLSLLGALAETQVEAKNDLPVVSVLDHAEVPKAPVGYPAALILGAGLLFGLVFGVIGAFAREYVRNAQQDPQNQAFFAAWEQFKADARALVPRRGRRQARLPIRGQAERL